MRKNARLPIHRTTSCVPRHYKHSSKKLTGCDRGRSFLSSQIAEGALTTCLRLGRIPRQQWVQNLATLEAPLSVAVTHPLGLTLVGVVLQQGPTLDQAIRVPISHLDYDPRTQTFGSGYQGSSIDPSFTGATIQSSYDPTEFRAQRVVDQMEQYQNPFLEDVLDRSAARLQEQFDTQQAARDLASTQAGGAGAFGSRGALARLTAQDQASRAIGDLEASQRAKAFDTALRAATADVDRDLRVQQLSDAAAQRAAQFDLTGQQLTGAFAQAAGAQDLRHRQKMHREEQLAHNADSPAVQDAAGRARGVQDANANCLRRSKKHGAQTLTAQQLRDQAARAAGQQTLTAQQLADQALRASGAQTLQAQIAGDAALRAAGTQALDEFRLSEAARQAAGDQTLRQSLANQRAYQDALARQDRAALAGVDIDRAEQALDLQRIGALSALGAQQRADAQAILDTQYADFLRQREFPREQLAFYSNLLRGVNPGQYASQTTRQAAPAANQSGQLLNFLMGAAQLAA